ncbi:hypothetical protein [Rhizobium leguminosarum]|uniref:ORC-CDC6 family AAA ATPase n=1 Tax=Rhizobium leguminosarum TaxID=384 RepID=UPI001C928C41|nr:hypothetical protein [Rhizobium leguminosarum]MBY2988679.1 hypothetical protein [Rhizobium leguminosarum]
MTQEPSGKTEELRGLFGSFRAEWLRERLFGLFNEPEYFPSLRDRRPCVLMGGRGTGKTTVLRCMSYEGQAALQRDDKAVWRPAYVGLYHKINSNRVTAFQGPELSEQEWRKLFAHYINLVIGEMMLDYLEWRLAKTPSAKELSAAACARIAKSFGLASAPNRPELAELVVGAKQALELYVNNLDSGQPTLSMLQAPIDVLTGELSKLEADEAPFFYILLDEYENFLDYQQVVVNTLIKHSSANYVFKIGVKELGWRMRMTLGSEHLVAPADYELIQIERRLDRNFNDFARQVCEARLKEWSDKTGSPLLSLDALLPELPYDQEAKMLGVADRVQALRRRLGQEVDRIHLKEIDDLQLYVFWSLEKQDYDRTAKAVREFVAGSSHQRDRYSNYKYAMLFTITSNGAKISKYYCGNRVFSTIARNNIRYYLHLVSTAIDFHQASGRGLGTAVSFADQTLAAREVGLQYLTELEGVTVQGVQLVKLILGFGRLFQILSRNPIGNAPETMEFSIKKRGPDDDGVEAAVSQLITNAVMNLALVRSPGTKLATPTDVKQWDYSLHPIFSPYFNFSHRRKRKLDVSERELLSMVDAPQETIKLLLKGKAVLVDDEPPRQLQLFNEYYAGAS